MTVPTSNGVPSTPPASLAELSRRATVDKTDMSKYSIKSWIATVSKLYEQVTYMNAKQIHILKYKISG